MEAMDRVNDTEVQQGTRGWGRRKRQDSSPSEQDREGKEKLRQIEIVVFVSFTPKSTLKKELWYD